MRRRWMLSAAAGVGLSGVAWLESSAVAASTRRAARLGEVGGVAFVARAARVDAQLEVAARQLRAAQYEGWVGPPIAHRAELAAPTIHVCPG
jgi:hypothetical protein